MDETQVRAEAARKTIKRKYKALTSTVSRSPIPEALYEKDIIGEEMLEIATINPVFTNREKGNRIIGISKDLSDELKSKSCRLW